MLKMNFFMFTLTVSLSRRKLSGAEFENYKRIKMIEEELEQTKVNYYRF